MSTDTEPMIEVSPPIDLEAIDARAAAATQGPWSKSWLYGALRHGMLSALHTIAMLAAAGALAPPPNPDPLTPRRGRRLELAGRPGEPNHVLEIPADLTTRAEIIAFINGKGVGWFASEGPTEEQISMSRVPAEEAPKPIVTDDGDAYHRHLDVCEQCIANPFDLCALGRRLLEVAALGPRHVSAAVAQVDREHRAQYDRDRMARAEAKRERKRRAREAR